jgi:hypothetical protein
MTFSMRTILSRTYLKNNKIYVVASPDDVCRDEAIWILKKDCFVVP